jgi:squalene-associated FAD-dependent desaturase
VTVVGGGLAGISAALQCARQGAAVTLLESRGRLGGAAYSFDRDGLRIDNGQHVFLRCCVAYRALLRDFGAEDLVTLQPRLRITVLAPGGRRAVLARGRLPAPVHLAGALLRYPFIGVSQRLSVARAMQALRSVDVEDPAVDERSFGDWLIEHGQDRDALEAIWDLIARPTLNLTPADASLAQAAQVFQLGLLADAAAGDVGYAVVPLSEIHDVAARRALAAAGVGVRLEHGVNAITQTEAGFVIEHRGGELESSFVILAVPPTRATRLLSTAPSPMPDTGIDARGLGSSPIVNLHVVYDRPVLDVPFAAGVHTPVQWVFDRTSASGLRSGQYLAVSLSAATEELGETADQLRRRYLPALGELLPEARAATVEAFHVTREHAATFRAAPGARALRPGPRTPISGLFLAGTWTDTGWPATMEGAVLSGYAAARQILMSTATRQPALSTPRT